MKIASSAQVSTPRRPFASISTDTPPPEIYTLSLHDALPIFTPSLARFGGAVLPCLAHAHVDVLDVSVRDRKSTRLNSSHANISYAVFCLKKKSGEARRDRPHQVDRLPVRAAWSARERRAPGG